MIKHMRIKPSLRRMIVAISLSALTILFGASRANAQAAQWGCPSGATWCTNQGGGEHPPIKANIPANVGTLEAIDNAVDAPQYTGSPSTLPWNYGVIGEIGVTVRPIVNKAGRVRPNLQTVATVNVDILYGGDCDPRYSLANCSSAHFQASCPTGQSVVIPFSALAVNLPAGNNAAGFGVIVTATQPATVGNVDFITEEHDNLPL